MKKIIDEEKEHTPGEFFLLPTQKKLYQQENWKGARKKNNIKNLHTIKKGDKEVAVIFFVSLLLPPKNPIQKREL